MSSIKQSRRRSSYGGVVESPIRCVIDEPVRVTFPKSAPASPTNKRFKSPGTALVSVSRMVLDEPDDEMPFIVKQLPMLNLEQQEQQERQPMIGLKATRVVRRSVVAEPPVRVAVVHSRPAGRQTRENRPKAVDPVRPRVHITDQPQKPRLTVPMQNVPRFMQPTASARRRVAASSDKHETAPTASKTAVHNNRNRPSNATHRSAVSVAKNTNRNTVPIAASLHRNTASSKSRTAAIVPSSSRAPAHASHNRTQTTNARNETKAVRVVAPTAPGGMTVPATPPWARDRSRVRNRERILTTEEREMEKVLETKRRLKMEREKSRIRRAQGENRAMHDNRYLRVASNFSPAKSKPIQKSGDENRSNAPARGKPMLTNPQPFRFQTEARRKF